MQSFHLFFHIYRYFSEGFQAIEHFGGYIAELSGKLAVIKQVQEDEKSDLIEVRNSLKNSPGLEKLVSYNFTRQLMKVLRYLQKIINYIRSRPSKISFIHKLQI